MPNEPPVTIEDLISLQSIPSRRMVTGGYAMGADPQPKFNIGAELANSDTAYENIPWWFGPLFGALGGGAAALGRSRIRPPAGVQDNVQQNNVRPGDRRNLNVTTRPHYTGEDDLSGVEFRNRTGLPQVDADRLAFWARQYGSRPPETNNPNVRPFTFDPETEQFAMPQDRLTGTRPLVPANRGESDSYNLAIINQLLGTDLKGQTPGRAPSVGQLQTAKQKLDELRDTLTAAASNLMAKPKEQWSPEEHTLAAQVVRSFEELDKGYNTLMNATHISQGNHTPHAGPHAGNATILDAQSNTPFERNRYISGDQSRFDASRRLHGLSETSSRMSRGPWIRQEHAQQMVDSYNQGNKTVAEVAKEFNRDPSVVLRILQREGVDTSPRNRASLPQDKIDDILRRNMSGESWHSIALSLGMNRNTLRNRLIDAGYVPQPGRTPNWVRQEPNYPAPNTQPTNRAQVDEGLMSMIRDTEQQLLNRGVSHQRISQILNDEYDIQTTPNQVATGSGFWRNKR